MCSIVALCSEYTRSLIPENVLPVNALRAGASLPVAIVAGCLELLRRIPGFTMIGTLLKLGIGIAIDFIGIEAKEINYRGKRDLLLRQKRPSPC